MKAAGWNTVASIYGTIINVLRRLHWWQGSCVQGVCPAGTHWQRGYGILESLCNLPVNMHEKVIGKNSVKSKCFDADDWNNKKGGVRKWDKYNTILDYFANRAGIPISSSLKLAILFPFNFKYDIGHWKKEIKSHVLLKWKRSSSCADFLQRLCASLLKKKKSFVSDKSSNLSTSQNCFSTSNQSYSSVLPLKQKSKSFQIKQK